jgi:hypothetical protein
MQKSMHLDVPFSVACCESFFVRYFRLLETQTTRSLGRLQRTLLEPNEDLEGIASLS